VCEYIEKLGFAFMIQNNLTILGFLENLLHHFIY